MKHLSFCATSIFAVLSLATIANAADLQNPDLTPGCAIGEPCSKSTVAVNLFDLCTPGYTQGVRNVPEAEKNAVYREYRISTRKPGEYEIDHLISLELGGSNELQNLWPQSYVTCPWNAHVKDKFENYLHSQVCQSKITLADAQHAIRTDWIAAYHQYLGNPPACKE